jgi:hypothetical protein
MPKQTPYLALQNFRFGLDARRSELTSQPGTLMRAVDCHINQGAEIEKRKAFPKTALPANTFGLLATSNGLMTFGSESAAAIGALPSPFIYQQLVDPNEGFSLFNITEVKGVSTVVSDTITTWQVYGSTSHGGVTVYDSSGVNPGFVVGNNIVITGTGSSVLDGNTFPIINILGFFGSYYIVYFTIPHSSTNTNGIGGTITQTTYAAAQLTVSSTMPSGFGIGSVFNVFGFTDPQITFLNGTQTATAYSISGTTSYIKVAASFSGDITGSPVGTLSLGTGTGNAMVAIVAACLFNGNPFVVARFGDGDVGIFNNGSLVNDFFNGAVFSNATSNDDLATQLCNYINATTGYLATVNGASVTCTSVNPNDTTKSIPGDNFAASVSTTTASGTFTETPIAQAVASVTGEAATAQFQIVAISGSGTPAINSIHINAVDNVNLLSAAVDYTTSIQALATAIAQNITENAGSNGGYTAQAISAGVVQVTAPVGVQYNDFNLTINTTGIAIDNCYFIINIGVTGTCKIGPIKVGTVDILNGVTVNSSGDTLDQWADAIVTAINSGGQGYIGIHNAANDVGASAYIYISRSPEFSAPGAPVGSSLTSTTSSSLPVVITYTSASSWNGSVNMAVTNAGFTASVSKTSVTNTVSGRTPSDVTGSVLATPIGGTPPYSYLWQNTGANNLITAVTPTKAKTTFLLPAVIQKTYVNGNITYIAAGGSTTFYCLITDSTPSVNDGPFTAYTPSVQVNFVARDV